MIEKWIVLGVLFFCIFVFVLLFGPFKMSVMAYFDVRENVLVYVIKVLGFRLLCGRMWLSAKGLVVENEHGRFQNNPPVAKIIPHFVSRLFTRLDVFSFGVIFEGGKRNDAATSAFVCGSADVFFSWLFCLLKANNQHSMLRKNIIYNFYEDKFNLTAYGTVVVSLFETIKSFICARIDMKKLAQTKSGKGDRTNGKFD